MLAQTPKRGPGRYDLNGSREEPLPSTLASIGIDKKLSAVSQRPCRCAQAGSGEATRLPSMTCHHLGMKLPSMAVFALPLALAFHVLGDDAPTGPKDLGTVTIGDKTYTNLHVTSVTDLGIKATWDGGLGTILFSDMPPDLQKKFGYDPNKFKAAKNAQAEHDAQSDAEAVTQAKVDQANLQRSDADATKQRAAMTAPAQPDPTKIKYLHGTVSSTVDGGYDIYLVERSAYEPMPYHYPLAGVNIDVVLKSGNIYTVGQFLKIPVLEAGIYTDNSGNHYKQYKEVDRQ